MPSLELPNHWIDNIVENRPIGPAPARQDKRTAIKSEIKKEANVSSKPFQLGASQYIDRLRTEQS